MKIPRTAIYVLAIILFLGALSYKYTRLTPPTPSQTIPLEGVEDWINNRLMERHFARATAKSSTRKGHFYIEKLDQLYTSETIKEETKLWIRSYKSQIQEILNLLNNETLSDPLTTHSTLPDLSLSLTLSELRNQDNSLLDLPLSKIRENTSVLHPLVVKSLILKTKLHLQNHNLTQAIESITKLVRSKTYPLGLLKDSLPEHLHNQIKILCKEILKESESKSELDNHYLLYFSDLLILIGSHQDAFNVISKIKDPSHKKNQNLKLLIRSERFEEAFVYIANSRDTSTLEESLSDLIFLLLELPQDKKQVTKKIHNYLLQLKVNDQRQKSLLAKAISISAAYLADYEAAQKWSIESSFETPYSEDAARRRFLLDIILNKNLDAASRISHVRASHDQKNLGASKFYQIAQLLLPHNTPATSLPEVTQSAYDLILILLAHTESYSVKNSNYSDPHILELLHLGLTQAAVLSVDKHTSLTSLKKISESTNTQVHHYLARLAATSRLESKNVYSIISNLDKKRLLSEIGSLPQAIQLTHFTDKPILRALWILENSTNENTHQEFYRNLLLSVLRWDTIDHSS